MSGEGRERNRKASGSRWAKVAKKGRGMISWGAKDVLSESNRGSKVVTPAQSMEG